MFLFARCLHLLVIREWRCQDIDQVLLHGRCFLSSASSSTEVRGQNRSTSILSKLPTTACWFRKNAGKDSKLAVSDSKCASFVEPNTAQLAYVQTLLRTNSPTTCQLAW